MITKPGLIRAVVPLLLLLGLTQCADPVSDQARRSSTSLIARGSATGAVSDTIHEVRLNRSGLPLESELSDAALVDAIRTSDSIVVIGFKPPHAARTRQSGIVPAMSRRAANEYQASVVDMGVTIVRRMLTSSSIVARIPPGLAPAIRRLPFVNYVAPTTYAYPSQSPPIQDTSWGAAIINAPYVWANINAGNFAWITMLDSGVDSLHVVDDDLDGPSSLLELIFIDGFTTNAPYQDPVKAHGSLVAGVMSARNNGFGWIGVAHNPYGFSSVRVCSPQGYPPELACPLWAIESALDWTAANGHPRQIVNMSLAGCVSGEARDVFQEFVQRSLDSGNLLVASAGNYPGGCGPQGYVLYPAKFPGVLAVSGTLINDQFASTTDPANNCVVGGVTYGSRYGPEVAISAPFLVEGAMSGNGSFDANCGTAFAAPLVSAVAAMVWSQNPTWTAAAVKSRLEATANDLGTVGRDQYFGYGRVNAYAATYFPPPPPFSVTITGFDQVKPYSACLYQALPVNGSPPYSFAWTANGMPVGEDSPTYRHYAGTTPFLLVVTVTGSPGQTSGSLSVSIDEFGQECLDQ